MTLGQAMQKAIRLFEHNAKKIPGAEIRGVFACEMSGHGNTVESATLRIHYAINGDYTQSDKHPYLIHVYLRDNKVRIGEYIEE